MKESSGIYRAARTALDIETLGSRQDDDMADKNRAQGKSKKALTKKAKLKKKEVKS